MRIQPQFADTLRQFRDFHPKRFLSVGSERWEFVESGSGSNSVVILGGGGSTAESMISVNIALSYRSHVISIGLPAKAMAIDRVVCGIEAIMESLGVEKAVFLGHSLGGMVIQYFALRRPYRVVGLVLSGTAFYLGIRSYVLPLVSKWMGFAPMAILIHLVKSQMNRLLGPVPESQFWISFYDEELNQSDAGARLKYQFQLLAELAIFFRNNPRAIAASDLNSIPVQIISAEDDRGFTKREIAFLGNLYRNVQTVILPPGTGHLSFLTQLDEYIQIVQQYIQNIAHLTPPQ